ncbi:MAG: hypothetical protein LQ350_000751 [Teloschistes chrysophthalmus]|nr:MAG: hypothetical protein LQ350_000751 [Niorma chrysophthalma]
MKTFEVSPEPVSDGELSKGTMAQIYRDFHNAWSSGMANVGAMDRELSDELIGVREVMDFALFGLKHEALQSKSSTPEGSLKYGSSTPFSVSVCTRFTGVAESHGWMMLSMLAYSNAFRNACYSYDQASWARLMQLVRQNHVSLELFFKVRGLDWQSPLQYIGRLVPSAVFSFTGYIQSQASRELPAIHHDNLHSYVVPSSDGLLRRPSYQGLLQLGIPYNEYDPNTFAQDPSLCNTKISICASCGNHGCDCEPASCDNVTRPLVELNHFSGNKGTGVRSLQRIRKGEVLDEYVGELKHASALTDLTYALELEHPGPERTANRDAILIDAQLHGNWTRYINASCNPSLKFMPAIVGKRYRMMIVATRDIDVFEELTIGYGAGYWLSLDVPVCECNEPDYRYGAAAAARKEHVQEMWQFLIKQKKPPKDIPQLKGNKGPKYRPRKKV